jgi:hypothetical protein
LEANGALANLLRGGEWDGEGEEERRQGVANGTARMRAARGRLGLRDVEWRGRRGRTSRLRM